MGRVTRTKKKQVKTSEKKTFARHLTLDEHLRNLAEILVERIMEEQQTQKGLSNG